MELTSKQAEEVLRKVGGDLLKALLQVTAPQNVKVELRT